MIIITQTPKGIFLKKILTLFLSALSLFATLCCDGSYSASIGKGTCSHHGGVCESVEIIQTDTKPLAPDFVEATDSVYENKIVIRWAKSPNADYYEIYISKDGDHFRLLKSHYTQISYTYKALLAKRIFFGIRACNQYGCSDIVYDSGSVLSDILECEDIEVVDGDTLQHGSKKFRLYGIDAPESYDGSKMDKDSYRCHFSQELIKNAGLEAKHHLSYLLDISSVCTFVKRYNDRYGRSVVILFADDKSINEAMVADGYAIAWDRYIEEEDLKTKWHQLQSQALQNRLGLWRDFCPLMNCMSERSYPCQAIQNEDPIQKIKSQILQKSEYKITGYFSPYDFDHDGEIDKPSDWVYVSLSTSHTYQLLGDMSKENLERVGIFGWKRVEIPHPHSLFYMVKFGEDKFDWLIFSAQDKHCNHIYKLSGQDPSTKAFSYDIDGDGKNDMIDLQCEIIEDEVRFFQE